MNRMSHEVAKCTSPNCFWFSWRFKKQPSSSIKAIRRYCLEECVGKEVKGRYKEVEICNPRLACSLHSFRMGKNPNPRKISDEQRTKLAEQMRHIQKSQATLEKHRQEGLFPNP